MGRLAPRFEVLPSSQSRLWPQLAPAAPMGFVLYGGTAIALRLGHRASVDFDFFSDRTFEVDDLHKAFGFLARATVLQQQPNSYTILTADQNDGSGVKVSFFGGLSMGRVGEPDVTDDDVLQVASLDDLLASKLKVVLQRVESRDYVDIAALLVTGMSLERGLAAARVLYGRNFQPNECLKALVYFEGGDLENLDEKQKRTLLNSVSTVTNLPIIEKTSTSLASQ